MKIPFNKPYPTISCVLDTQCMFLSVQRLDRVTPKYKIDDPLFPEFALA